MSNKIKENRIFILISSLIVSAMIGVLLYYGNIKQGFHMDELLTYGLSNSYFFPFPFTFGEWLPSSYFHDYLTVNGQDAFAYDSVYYNQASDVHPPIYYIIIHTISSFFQGDFTKWIGLAANVSFYLLTILSIFSFAKYLFKDKWIALLVASFWGFSVGAVSSVMFIRMYVLLTLWFILFLYASTLLLNRKEDSYHVYLFIMIVTIGGTLTQYYFLIGAFFISSILSVLLVIKKRWRSFYAFVLTMIMGLSFSYILFPPILKHILNTGRGQEATANMAEGSSHFLEFFKIIDSSLFANKGVIMGLFSLLLLAAAFVSVSFGKTQRRLDSSYFLQNLALFIIPAVLYLAVIQRIAPYQTSRYILAIFPAIVFSLFFIIFFALTTFIKNNIIIRWALLFLTVSWTVMGYRNIPVENLFTGYASIMKGIEEYKDNDALVIEDAVWKITGNLLELKEFNDVLPILVDPNEVQLPEDDKLLYSEDLIVMVSNSFDQETMIKDINKKYGFKQATKLYEHQGKYVYYFE